MIRYTDAFDNDLELGTHVVYYDKTWNYYRKGTVVKLYEHLYKTVYPYFQVQGVCKGYVDVQWDQVPFNSSKKYHEKYLNKISKIFCENLVRISSYR